MMPSTLQTHVGTAVAAALLSIGLLLGLLAVQHYRHGWPFALHHGVAQDVQATLPGTPPAGLASHDRHARAAVELDAGRVSLAGITVEPARAETVTQSVRAVANVVPDERRISHVHTRVAGWIEELPVAATGDRVTAGQPVAGIFSQDLYASQVEYLTALAQARSGPRSAVVSSARARLEVLGMSEAELSAIERTGKPHRLVTVTAPRTGVVLRRAVSAGTAVDPSTELLTLADLSTIWVVAELPTAEMGGIELETPVELHFAGLPQSPVESAVDFIYPTLSERTRTTRVRMVLDNAGGQLRPGMFGSALFKTPPRAIVSVPRDAVVDTGPQQHVFVLVGAGRFEPRPVTLGVSLSERMEIVEGITEGERVVSSGVFLLDSESRLRSVGVAGLGHAGHGQTAPTEPPAKREGHAGHQP